MKRLFCLLLLLGFFHSSFSQTGHDKDYLANYYEQTFDNLEAAVENLSEKQLQFKAGADKWSVSQCLEHIALSEKMLLEYVKKTMELPPSTEKKAEVKMTDEGLIKAMTDRSFKAQAPKEMVPKEKGAYKSAAKALEDIRAQRMEILDYLNDFSIEDMRSRVTESPFGLVDGYHTFLYIPSHTARHTLQIEEIKAEKGFPMK